MQNMTQEFKEKSIPLFFCDLRSRQAEDQKDRLLSVLKKDFPSLQMDWGYCGGVAIYSVLVDDMSLSVLLSIVSKCKEIGISELYREVMVSDLCSSLGMSFACNVATLLESACEAMAYTERQRGDGLLYGHASKSLTYARRFAESIEDEEVKSIVLSIPKSYPAK